MLSFLITYKTCQDMEDMGTVPEDMGTAGCYKTEIRT